MTTYRVKTGHNAALETLTVLSPQPDEDHGGGIQYTRILDSGDGTMVKEGPYFPFHWTELTATQYSTILTAFGLASADSALVTVYVRNDAMASWVRMNGVALKPLPGDMVQWNNRPRNVTILVRNLSAVT